MQCIPISLAWGPTLLTCTRLDLFALHLVISVFGLLTDVVVLLQPVPARAASADGVEAATIVCIVPLFPLLLSGALLAPFSRPLSVI